MIKKNFSYCLFFSYENFKRHKMLQNRLHGLSYPGFCLFLCNGTGRVAGPLNLKKKNFMEQLNRIELRGVVGSVSTQTFSENRMARITVATNYAYKDKNGAAVIDTSWHSVVAWSGRGIADLDKIEKGAKIYVQGRVRYQRYTATDGLERIYTEIVANRLVLIDEAEPMQYEYN